MIRQQLELNQWTSPSWKNVGWKVLSTLFAWISHVEMQFSIQVDLEDTWWSLQGGPRLPQRPPMLTKKTGCADGSSKKLKTSTGSFDLNIYSNPACEKKRALRSDPGGSSRCKQKVAVRSSNWQVSQQPMWPHAKCWLAQHCRNWLQPGRP